MDLPEMKEAELIRLCQEGNQKAFENLVQRYYQKAYMIAMFYVKNAEVALDISQEAFVRIYRHMKRFDFTYTFSQWLYRIVKNLSLNYLQRKRARWIPFSDAFAQRNGQASHIAAPAEDQLEKNQTIALVDKALRQLPEKDREIIIMKDFMDMSYQEIADALAIPMGTVMSRLYYARQKLAEHLKEVWHDLT